MHMLRDKWILALLFGIFLGAIFSLLTEHIVFADKGTTDSLVAEYYQVENAVHVSPHSLRGKMDKGDQSFVLVDVRSQEEYEKEHIVGAVSIPAYKDKYTSAYDEVDRIVDSFEKIKKEYPNRELIVYCYSIPCMTGRKVGAILAENGVYVKQLNIGWYEWRHDWNSWNHEHEWETNKVEDYINSGKNPGEPKKSNLINPCVEGEFGC